MIFIVINTSLSYEIINFIIILICHLNRSGEKTEKKRRRSEICCDNRFMFEENTAQDEI